MYPIKLSMMSFMMGNMSPEDIGKCAIECGMTSIDWIPLHHSTAGHLKLISDDAGLQVIAHTPLDSSFVNGSFDGIDEFKLSIENTSILGAPNIVVPPFPLTREPLSIPF